jgi:hypothetical protein
MVDEFRAAVAAHGPPASTLTDNGMVFTTRPPTKNTATLTQVRGVLDLLRDHKAEGVGFEPTMRLTPHSGFQDRRHRPLGEPSRPATRASWPSRVQLLISRPAPRSVVLHLEVPLGHDVVPVRRPAHQALADDLDGAQLEGDPAGAAARNRTRR